MLFKNITLLDHNFKVQTGMNLLTSGDKITYISEELPDNYEGEIYKGENKVILPGFFNTHCHIPMTLLRGYGEGLPLQRWLFEKIFPFEARLTPKDCYWGSLLGAMEMIRSGVVSYTDMYFNIEDIVLATKESGLKANISHGTSANPNIQNFKELVAYKDTQRMLEMVRADNDDSIKIDMGLHAEYTSNESLVRQLAEYAKANNLIVHTHISETQSEHEKCKEKYGLTPLGYFEKCGLLENPVVAAHCVWIEDEDFNIIKEKEVTPVHCISSNLKLGSGFAPIKKMLDMGIPVGIGTDGASSNNNLNMIEEIHIASLVNKGVTRDPQFMSPKEIIKLATLNGALSQGRTDTGSIKVGNKADIIVFDMDKPHLQPVFDVLSNIVYSASAEDICLTMINGKLIYKDGEFLNIDSEEVIYESNKIKNRISAELSLERGILNEDD
ncbi:MAG: amidohydrolase [Tissierellia bacterium]|nr:amidohydrolase [Tissierellia bacterium]